MNRRTWENTWEQNHTVQTRCKTYYMCWMIYDIKIIVLDWNQYTMRKKTVNNGVGYSTLIPNPPILMRDPNFPRGDQPCPNFIKCPFLQWFWKLIFQVPDDGRILGTCRYPLKNQSPMYIVLLCSSLQPYLPRVWLYILCYSHPGGFLKKGYR